MQRISPQQHPHLRKVSVSESNVLLDEEVLTDPKIQALLLTILVSSFYLALEIAILAFCQEHLLFSLMQRVDAKEKAEL